MSTYLERTVESRPFVGELQTELPLLDKLAREMNLRSPEDVARYWRMAWKEDGEKVGLSLQVPDFPDSSQGLASVEILGGNPIYVPPQVSTSETRHLFGLMCPEMAESFALQEGNHYTNETDHSGWRYVASPRHAPYLGTTEDEMKKILETLGAESINLTEFVIAAKYSQRRTGHFLDERTWLRIPIDDGMLGVRFFEPRARLRVVKGLELAPQGRCWRLGFRWSMPVSDFWKVPILPSLQRL